MKATLLISIMYLLSSTYAYTTEYTAPIHVKQVFAQMFPEVENVHWEKWNREVVAIFKDREGLKKAFFNEQGIWLETRRKLQVHQLPIYVQTTLHESYPDMEVTYAGKVYRPQEIVYRVESESKDAVIVKLFEEGGMLVSEENIPFSTQILQAIAPVSILPIRNVSPKTRPLLLKSGQ